MTVLTDHRPELFASRPREGVGFGFYCGFWFRFPMRDAGLG